jgi:hypothetical protein
MMSRFAIASCLAASVSGLRVGSTLAPENKFEVCDRINGLYRDSFEQGESVTIGNIPDWDGFFVKKFLNELKDFHEKSLAEVKSDSIAMFMTFLEKCAYQSAGFFEFLRGQKYQGKADFEDKVEKVFQFTGLTADILWHTNGAVTADHIRAAVQSANENKSAEELTLPETSQAES